MIDFAIALGFAQYLDTSEPEPTIRLEVAPKESPVYVWGQYEELTTRMVGQRLGNSSITSFGLGVKHHFDKKLYVFGELGYGIVDEGSQDIVQQEVVYTLLVDHHLQPFRPLPVYPTGPYDQDSYETLWEVEDSILGSIGIGYQAWDNVAFTVAYRPFYAKETVELWDADSRANGGGWWQESNSRNYSSVEFKIKWSF